MTIETLPVTTDDNYPVRVGVAIDEMLNVIFFNGQPYQTISGHAALAAQAGQPWACLLCKILNVIVERDHCQKQFDSQPTKTLVAIRSVVALMALALPILGLIKLGALLL
jgi:hypothetical protein